MINNGEYHDISTEVQTELPYFVRFCSMEDHLWLRTHCNNIHIFLEFCICYLNAGMVTFYARQLRLTMATYAIKTNIGLIKLLLLSRLVNRLL